MTKHVQDEASRFKAGEVWEWNGFLYLLLRRDSEKEIGETIKADNQQIWKAFSFDYEQVEEVRLHTNVFWSKLKWKRVS